MLQTNQSCRRPLSTLSTIASRKYTSLKQVIGINTIHDNKKKLIKAKNNHHKPNCILCNSKRCLCCQQLIKLVKHLTSTIKTTEIER